MANPEIERIAEEVIEEYRQSDDIKRRFLAFYENTVDNNFGRNDLRGLINTIELTEEEELDEF